MKLLTPWTTIQIAVSTHSDMTMQSHLIYDPTTYTSMPWRNGLGHTVELLKHDVPDTDTFAWRLSMADVVTNGEFSNFTGFNRTLLLLKGNGMTLEFVSGRRVELTERLQMTQFKGDEPTVATLHDGPITDFNVMCSRTHCRAEVISSNTHAQHDLDVHCNVLLVYSLGDVLTLRTTTQERITVAERHLFCATEPVRQTLQVSGAAFVAVQICYQESC
jgi:environmental stress-induced protein Ves